MQQVQAKIHNCNTDQFREFLLCAVRCGRARVQLMQLELDTVGVALRNNMVEPEVAVEWLNDIGALPYIDLSVEETSASAVRP